MKFSEFKSIVENTILKVPGGRTIVALVGVSAVLVIILGFGIEINILFWGIVAIFVFGVVMLVFSAAAQDNASLQLPAIMFVWSITAMALLGLAGIVSSFFLDWPKNDLFKNNSKIFCEVSIPHNNAWILAGWYNSNTEEWDVLKYVDLVKESTSNGKRLTPFVENDIIEIVKQKRKLVIMRFMEEGYKQKDVCPAKFRPNNESRSEVIKVADPTDYTGTIIPIGQQLIVKEYCVGNLVDKNTQQEYPRQIVWLKVNSIQM